MPRFHVNFEIELPSVFKIKKTEEETSAVSYPLALYQ